MEMIISSQRPCTTIRRLGQCLHHQLPRCFVRFRRHVEVCTTLGVCWSSPVYSNNLPRRGPIFHNDCTVGACFCCFWLCFSSTGSLPPCVPLDDSCGICQQRLPMPLLCRYRHCLLSLLFCVVCTDFSIVGPWFSMVTASRKQKT